MKIKGELVQPARIENDEFGIKYAAAPISIVNQNGNVQYIQVIAYDEGIKELERLEKGKEVELEVSYKKERVSSYFKEANVIEHFELQNQREKEIQNYVKAGHRNVKSDEQITGRVVIPLRTINIEGEKKKKYAEVIIAKENADGSSEKLTLVGRYNGTNNKFKDLEKGLMIKATGQKICKDVISLNSIEVLEKKTKEYNSPQIQVVGNFADDPKLTDPKVGNYQYVVGTIINNNNKTGEKTAFDLKARADTNIGKELKGYKKGQFIEVKGFYSAEPYIGKDKTAKVHNNVYALETKDLSKTQDVNLQQSQQQAQNVPITPDMDGR